MISPFFKSKIENSDKILFSSIGQKYPSITEVSILSIDKNSLTLNISTKEETKATVVIHDSENIYEYISIYGSHLENKFTVSSIEGWDPTKYDFSGYIQKLIPEGSKYLENYNQKLFEFVINKSKSAIVTSSVSGVIKSKRFQFILDDPAMIFEISNEESTYQQMKINPTISLLFQPTGHSNPVIVEAEVDEYMDGKVKILPKSMKYGGQTDLETYKIAERNSLRNELKTVVQGKFSYWKRMIRFPLLLSSFLPVILGSSLAYSKTGRIDILLLLLTILGLILIQSGINMLTDYFDHLSGNDDYKLSSSPISGGRIIRDGIALPRDIVLKGIILSGIALIVGLFLNSRIEGDIVLILGIIGGSLAYSYAGKPLRFSYYGLGEVVILLVYGPIPVLAGYIIQGVSINLWLPLLVGVVPGIFSALIILFNNLYDHEADELVNKRTLVVLLGKKNSIKIIQVSLFLPIILIIILSTLSVISYWNLLIIFLFPLLYLFYREIEGLDLNKIYNQLFLLNLLFSGILSIVLFFGL